MRVVIDTFNSALEQGTGIATYSRALAQSLHRLGHTVDLMTSAAIPRERLWSSSRPVPAPVLLWDHPKSARNPRSRNGSDAPLWVSNTVYSIRSLTDYLFAGMAGGRVRQFGAAQLGIVDRKPLTVQYGHFDGVLNVPNVYTRAMSYFARTGRFLSISPKEKIDVAHFSWCLPIRVEGARNVYTICDLIPLRFPSMTLDNKSTFFRLVDHCIRNGDKIVTISESSRREIAGIMEVPDTIISNGYLPFDVEPSRLASSIDTVAPRLRHAFGLEPRAYFLIAGTVEPRKNVNRAVSAFLSADTDCSLVICGPRNGLSPDVTRLLEEMIRVGRGRILMLDYLPRPLLLDLVQGARAAISMSLAEGFGLPVLEAMALGTPVIASDIETYREVCQNSAILVDPYDTPAIAAALERVSRWGRSELVAAGEAGRRRAAEFSPGAFDRRISEIYATL